MGLPKEQARREAIWRREERRDGGGREGERKAEERKRRENSVSTRERILALLTVISQC